MGMMPLGLVVDVEKRKRDTKRGIFRTLFNCSKMTAGLGRFLQGKMDLQARTEFRRMDQKEIWSGEVLPDTVINEPWML